MREIYPWHVSEYAQKLNNFHRWKTEASLCRKFCPIQHTKTLSNSGDKRSAFQRSNQTKIFEPLANHKFDRRKFDPVHHCIKNTKFIHTNNPNILSRKAHNSNSFMHQTQGRVLNIIAACSPRGFISYDGFQKTFFVKPTQSTTNINWAALKTQKSAEIFPRKRILLMKELEHNTLFRLHKSAEKLDG